MEGATFKFSNQGIIVSNQGTTANNKFKITGIVPDYPKGCKYSAMIQVNDNEDVLTLVDENLMVLGWGGGYAKLRLQR
jgi:hypothetical protein